MAGATAKQGSWRKETESRILDKLKDLGTVFRDQSGQLDPVDSSNRFAAGLTNVLGDEAFISISLRGADPGYYRVMRIMHQNGVDHPGLTDTLFAGPDAPYVTGGVFNEVIQTGDPVLLRDLDVPDDPVMGNQLAPYRVLLSVPVYNEGEASNYVVFLSTDPDAYDAYASQVHLLVANLIGNVNNGKRMLQELSDAHRWIEQEIDEIERVQRSLVPWEIPRVIGLDSKGYYETFDRAGGDYYDVLPLADGSGRWIVFIGDASGHGPSAAVLVAMLNALLHNAPASAKSPGDILAHLNNYLCARSINHFFVTAFCAVYDPRDRSFDYASAGHNMPIVREADGKMNMFLPTGGVPLGVVSDYEFKVAEKKLEPGQAVLLYTDGIIEAESPQGVQFREARLINSLETATGTPDEQMAHIVRAVRDHEGGQRPGDDQSMLLIQVTG